MVSAGMEARLQELLDRDEIRQLTETYCHYVWQKDIRIVDLFTDDGAFTTDRNNPDRRSEGRAALLETYGRIMESGGPHPFIHNHVIEFQGPDNATGFCYL